MNNKITKILLIIGSALGNIPAYTVIKPMIATITLSGYELTVINFSFYAGIISLICSITLLLKKKG